MAIPDKRHDPVRLFARRLGLLALLVLVLAAASGVWDIYHKERESRALRDQAQMQLDDLTQQKTQLSAEISNLQTARGKEETLRQQYELGKQGEGLIIIVNPPTPKPVQASSTVMQWVHKFLPFW